MSFTRFSQLPAELQLQIWQTASSGPSMHVFDVCCPSEAGRARSQAALLSPRLDPKTRARLADTVFLDVAAVAVAAANPAGPDPSMYAFHQSLRATCVDAARCAAAPAAVNEVRLPGRGRTVRYDNGRDVLLLRFGAGGADVENDAGWNPVSAVLESTWSAEMARALRAARRVALELADVVAAPHGDAAAAAAAAAVRRPLLPEEVAYLACTLQERLEVLYLVVAGRGGRHAPMPVPVPSAGGMRARDGALWRALDGSKGEGALEAERRRAPDVVQGVGVAYREVFELEKLGWSEDHPAFFFAELIGDAIRQQQGGPGGSVFQGVRILVAEEEAAGRL